MKRLLPLLLGLGLIVALLVGVFAATDTRTAFDRVTLLLDWLRSTESPSWIGFTAAQAIVATVGIIPASLLSVAAGMTYGLWWGFLVACTGTLIGAWAAFSLSRSLLRPWIAAFVNRHGRLSNVDNALGADNWRFVCLVRISPIMPFSLTSYALGLTRIDYRSYMIGTLASLPALLAYVAIGAFAKAGLAATAGEMSFMRSISLGIGALAIVVTSLYLRRVVADALKTSPALPTMPV
jgi:uncharacterized membrane protein YdjX (TVP38/TMEM64 family)